MNPHPRTLWFISRGSFLNLLLHLHPQWICIKKLTRDAATLLLLQGRRGESLEVKLMLFQVVQTLSPTSCFLEQTANNKSRENGGSSSMTSRYNMLCNDQTQITTSWEMVETQKESSNNIKAKSFTFRELASATSCFKQEFLIGEGGFGRVYKGKLETTGQVVAVKQLDRNGLQRNKEFLFEIFTLSRLHHPNLVNLVGYCLDGDQRVLVYEFMPLGSLEDHLLDVARGQEPLDWNSRIKIALGAAKGLHYLHEKANPPVIYRDFKSSNILLDIDLNAKLSDFGLAKLGSVGDKQNKSSGFLGTYGYCAPEYQKTGHLTVKSDVYSFGVVLLELITGKRVIDTTRPSHQQNLVTWAQPIFREPNRFPELADPLLRGGFPEKSLNQAVAVAAMCLQEEPIVRPLISDVVTTLRFMSTETGSPTGLMGTGLNHFQPSSSQIEAVENQDVLQSYSALRDIMNSSLKK